MLQLGWLSRTGEHATKQPCLNQLRCSYKNSEYEILFTSKMYEKIYEFRRCQRCGLIYHDPGPEVAALKKRYVDYGKYSDPDLILERRKEREWHNERKARQLYRYLKTEKPRMLDVGCSNGTLLQHFSGSGYDCFGVEVDPASSAVAKRWLGEDRIFTGFLADSPFLDKSFDLVVCKQTIEHVPNPFEFLLHINNALKNKGLLYLDTPNFAGPSFRLLKDRWKNILPNDHISMFTPGALEGHLNKAGFRVLKRRIGSCTYNSRRSGEGGYQLTHSRLMKIFFRLTGLGLQMLNFGDGIAMISRKHRDIEAENVKSQTHI